MISLEGAKHERVNQENFGVAELRADSHGDSLHPAKLLDDDIQSGQEPADRPGDRAGLLRRRIPSPKAGIQDLPKMRKPPNRRENRKMPSLRLQLNISSIKLNSQM